LDIDKNLKNRLQTLKNNFEMKFFLKKISLAVVLTIGVCSLSTAQQFLIASEAVANMSAEMTSLQSQVSGSTATGTPEYEAALEEMRFLSVMMKDIQHGQDVEQTATKYLPKEESNKMQVAVRKFDSSFAGTSPNKYIRDKIIKLITS